MGNTSPPWPARPASTVHPHTRGEYTFKRQFANDAAGSPPHTWGIHPNRPSRKSPNAVHPHTRGEYSICPFKIPTSVGSPPHTWGIPRLVRSPALRRRFTPTHVGNTRRRRSHNTSPSVHPHTRGEYVILLLNFLDVRGSPPHTWGILQQWHFSQIPRRFTPTHVGNTAPPRAKVARRPVHPHTRGEYSHVCTCVNTPFGSPPHTWGIRLPRPVSLAVLRFTPTHVGNTGAYHLHYIEVPVHPHTRGEYHRRPLFARPAAGSPPHTWGIPICL